MKNIRITDATDYKLQQGESALGAFFWLVFALLVVIWLCHDAVEKTEPVKLFRSSYHTQPGSDASTLNLILDWF